MINNRDRKQLLLMKKFLHQYLENNIHLSELLQKLDDLVRLTTPKTKWKKVFFDNWLNLESLNTESSGTKRGALTDEEIKIHNLSINNIIKIIDDLLLSYEIVLDITVDNKAQEIASDWLFCPLCRDAWENNSKNPMVICPTCNEGLHNPRYVEERVSKLS